MKSVQHLSSELVQCTPSGRQRPSAALVDPLCTAELQSFARACSVEGAELCEDELEQVADYFETNEAGALTSGGFFQMVWMQTTARPQDTWSDLRELGYGDSLALLEKEPEGFPKEAEQVPLPALDFGDSPVNAGRHCYRRMHPVYQALLTAR